MEILNRNEHGKTIENLMRAFAGESQARNRYEMAAGRAKKESLPVIEAIFRFTANQEKEHAEVFYKYLTSLAGETIKIDGTYPVDISSDVSQLLRYAQHNEYEEHDDVYKNFGDKAQEEGFGKAAMKFHKIAEIEKMHGDRFGAFAKLLEENQLFVSKVETKWICLNCGYIYEGKEVPMSCPVCDHEQGWYVRLELAPYCGSCDWEKAV